MEESKKGVQMPFRVTQGLAADLRAAAASNEVEVQDLLREAARAIVRAQREFGRVPKDMEIRQRVISPAAASSADGVAATDPLTGPSEMLALLTTTTKRVLKEKDTAAEKAKAAKGRTPRT